jgi:hypothetical protein
MEKKTYPIKSDVVLSVIVFKFMLMTSMLVILGLLTGRSPASLKITVEMKLVLVTQKRATVAHLSLYNSRL